MKINNLLFIPSVKPKYLSVGNNPYGSRPEGACKEILSFINGCWGFIEIEGSRNLGLIIASNLSLSLFSIEKLAAIQKIISLNS